MIVIARLNMLCQCVRATNTRIQILPVPCQFIEQHIADPKLANLVRFNSAIKILWHAL